MQYKLPNSFYAAVCVVLIAANMGVYRAIFAPQMLTVTVLEVWKGNATLLQSPRGETLLIDTGPDASILRALGENLPMWQRDIDAVILTSSAARSAGGLPTVQSRYHISKIIRIGGISTPYGTSFVFDSSRIEILAPATLTIFSGTSVFKISSSTPAGVYSFN
jgi:glyoxylase-like metal-dependent hydrolase (beta-lactamase superfamily II)